MTNVFPEKLHEGDEIRVISPSSSIERVGGFDDNLIAKERLEDLGFKVTFGEHILDTDRLYSSSIEARIKDLHDAFLDTNVKAILTTIGGYNCNELLPYIDYEIIKNNPKIFIGYSDTTSLHNAFRAKTGLVTYYGPCYSAFKMDALQAYQSSEWLKAMTLSSYPLQASDVWTSDPWFDPSIPRHPMINTWKVYNHGSALGTIAGGNMQTYYLQAGTEFFLSVKEPIIFIEQAEGASAIEFSRELAQILQIHNDIKGLVIGRFPLENEVSEELLYFVLDKFPILKTIPVMYDIDFGHTQPICTFPIGGEIRIDTATKEIYIVKGH
jgi:muramoyltetrapeptide carboxypeptidase LdcA involved in peptidoglycan recycling